MALAPRSSLRPLVLLMSHGKPRLGSLFSSYAAAVPPPGNCTSAAPAVQPPSAPALPDCSTHKSPHNEESVLHALHDPPKKNKAGLKKSSPFTLENREHPGPLPCTVDQDPEHPVPDYGSYGNMPEPLSYADNPGLRNSEGVDHSLPDPPNRKGNAVLDKPSPSTPEHPDHLVPLLCTVDDDPKHPTPDGGSYSSTPEPVLGSDKPGPKPSILEDVKHDIPTPPLKP